MKEWFYIGIDPGLSGACIALNQDGEIAGSLALPHYADMPCYRKHKTRSVLDVDILDKWFSAFPDIRMIVVEESPPFKMGTVGAYTSGFNNGQLQLCVKRLMKLHDRSDSFVTVSAANWQRRICSGYGISEPWSKEVSISSAISLYEDFPLFTKPKKTADGFSDAAHIARYGMLLSLQRDEQRRN